MTTHDDRRRTLRVGRLQNARYFFLQSPLQFLETAQSLGVPLGSAFHGVGASLVAAQPARVFTEAELERARETAEALEEARGDFYAADYAYWAERNLRETGYAYTGD